jgi:hypothetical protein
MGKGLGKKEGGMRRKLMVGKGRETEMIYIDGRGRRERRWREVGNLKLRILSGRKLLHNGNVPSMKRLSGKISQLLSPAKKNCGSGPSSFLH